MKALHEQCRMLPCACALAGVAPGDKDSEWPEAHKRFTAKIGTIKTEAEIPRMTYEIFSGLKRVKAGMLMLNYIAMEALEAHPLPPFSLPPPSSLLSISHVLSISTTRPTSNTT